jgi:hypothetical protein
MKLTECRYTDKELRTFMEVPTSYTNVLGTSDYYTIAWTMAF